MKQRITLLLVVSLAMLGAVTLWMPLEQQAQGTLLRLAAHTRNFTDSSSYYADAVTFDVYYTGTFPNDCCDYSSYYGGEGSPINRIDGGVQVFRKTVFVPTSVNTLYVTMATTGNARDGGRHLFSCNLDRTDPPTPGTTRYCQPGPTRTKGSHFETPAGWIALQEHAGREYAYFYRDGFSYQSNYFLDAEEFTSNVITYTWCAQVRPGTHSVEIRMASAGDDGEALVAITGGHFFIDGSFIRNLQGCTTLGQGNLSD